MIRRPPRPPLFPYPTLSRSHARAHRVGRYRRASRPCRFRHHCRPSHGSHRGGPARPQHHPPEGRVGSEGGRSEEHTSELQSRLHLVCRLLLEKKKKTASGCKLLGMLCCRASAPGFLLGNRRMQPVLRPCLASLIAGLSYVRCFYSFMTSRT